MMDNTWIYKTGSIGQNAGESAMAVYRKAEVMQIKYPFVTF